MGNICCPAKKETNPLAGSSTENGGKGSSKRKKYELTELDPHSPIVNGAEMPVDVPDDMLDDFGRTCISLPSQDSDEERPPGYTENDPNGLGNAVGLVNPGFSDEEGDEESGSSKKGKKPGSESSSDAGSLSRQSTLRVRHEGRNEDRGLEIVEPASMDIRRDSSASDSSNEIVRDSDRLFGAVASQNQEQRQVPLTHNVTMSVPSEVHAEVNLDESSDDALDTSPTETNSRRGSEFRRQAALDQGFLMLSDATGAQESTDADLLDEVAVDFKESAQQQQRPGFDLFGGHRGEGGPEEMRGNDSMPFPMDSIWAQSSHEGGNDDQEEEEEEDTRGFDISRHFFDKPDHNETVTQDTNDFHAYGTEEDKPVMEKHEPTEKLVFNDIPGSQESVETLPTSNEDLQPMMIYDESDDDTPMQKSPVFNAPEKIAVMYGSDSDDSGSSTRSVCESPILSESALKRDSFDLFGAAPHSDMPVKPFPEIVEPHENAPDPSILPSQSSLGETEKEGLDILRGLDDALEDSDDVVHDEYAAAQNAYLKGAHEEIHEDSILQGSDFEVESDEDSEGSELELSFMKNGAAGHHQKKELSDEADRELEEIIMEIEVVEDALCCDLLKPGPMGTEEELGMHVMSQLAQLADLRDLLLNRQNVNPSIQAVMPTRMFGSEEEIEEWYVTEVGKVNDWCAVEILRRKFEQDLDADSLADILKEHQQQQENFRAMRDGAREQLGDDLRDQLKERSRQWPSGNVSSDDEEGDEVEEEDVEGAHWGQDGNPIVKNSGFMMDVFDNRVEDVRKESGLFEQDEDVERQSGQWASRSISSNEGDHQGKDEWIITGNDIKPDSEENFTLIGDAQTSLNKYASEQFDVSTCSSDPNQSFQYKDDSSENSDSHVEVNNRSLAEELGHSVVMPNENVVNGYSVLMNEAGVNDSIEHDDDDDIEVDDQELDFSYAVPYTEKVVPNSQTSIPKIITPAVQATDSFDSSESDPDVEEELRMAELMMEPIGGGKKVVEAQVDSDSDTDTEDLRKQYGGLIKSESVVEPLPSDHESEQSEEEEQEDCDPELSATLKDTLKADIRHSLVHMTADDFKDLMDVYRTEREGLRNVRDVERSRVDASLLGKLEERKRRSGDNNGEMGTSDMNSRDVGESAVNNFGAQTENNNPVLMQDASTDMHIVEDLAELDRKFLSESSVKDKAFLEMIEDHIESTDFLRQQRQQTLLQHQQTIKQQCSERKLEDSSSSSSENSDDEEDSPHMLITHDEQLEKRMSSAKDSALSRLSMAVSQQDVEGVLADHRDTQAQLMAHHQQRKQQLQDKLQEKLKAKKNASQSDEGPNVAKVIERMDEDLYGHLVSCLESEEGDGAQIDNLIEEHLDKVDMFKSKVQQRMAQLRKKRALEKKQKRDEGANVRDEAWRLVEADRDHAQQIHNMREAEKQAANDRLKQKLQQKSQSRQEYSTSPSLPGPRRPPRQSGETQRRHVPTNYENIDLL